MKIAAKACVSYSVKVGVYEPSGFDVTLM